MRRALASVGALVLVVVLAACAESGPEDGSVKGDAGGKPAPGARRVEVRASNFSFDPDELRVDVGEDVALALKSDEGTHDFAVEGIGLVAEVGGGDEDVQALRVDEAGRFAFYCSLPGHRDGGMEGTLVVRKP